MKQRKYTEGPTRVRLTVQEAGPAWGKAKSYYLHVNVRGKRRMDFQTYGTELKYAIRDARCVMAQFRRERGAA
jgi:hypothetical protein